MLLRPWLNPPGALYVPAPAPGGPEIAFGANMGVRNAPANTETAYPVTLTTGAPIGSLVHVHFFASTDYVPTSFTDTKGNTYTMTAASALGTQRMGFAYSILTTALTTSDTINMNGPGTSSSKTVRALYLTNVDTAAPLSVLGTPGTGNGNPALASVTTPSGNAYAIGITLWTSASGDTIATPDPNWTQIEQHNPAEGSKRQSARRLLAPASGTYTKSDSLNVSTRDFMSQIIVYKGT